MDAGYKNTLGSRKDVLITGMFYIGNARTVFQEIPGDGSYNRHVLITGVLISGIHCTYIALCTIKARNNTIRDYDDYM